MNDKKYTEANRQRVLAIIAHIKNGGGAVYDNAPQYIFKTKKDCPPQYKDYENKNSQQLLSEYENLLREIEANLE
jgi:hypothetical protein